jgi:hypothetical protein
LFAIRAVRRASSRERTCAHYAPFVPSLDPGFEQGAGNGQDHWADEQADDSESDHPAAIAGILL